jgi:hypothetical protein
MLILINFFAPGFRIGSRRASQVIADPYRIRILCLLISVADPDPVSGAFLTPGSGMKNPDHIFLSLETIFLS